MKRILITALVPLTMTACSQPEQAPATETPTVASAEATPVAAAAAQTPEQMCREAANLLYGQSGDAVTFDAATFDISWPAPVDGGRLTFACSFVGTQVSLARDGERQTVDVSASTAAPTQQGAQ